MNYRTGIVLLLLILWVTGCATNRYARLQLLTAHDRQEYNCENIRLELSRIDLFEARIERERKSNELTLTSFFSDLGIFSSGNAIERDSALTTAGVRKNELNDLSVQKNCSN